MLEKNKNSLSLRYFQSFLKYDCISHFISTRKGGFSPVPYDSLNLGFHVGDSPAQVLENRKLLMVTHGISPEKLTTAKQVHSNKVKMVTGEMQGSGAFQYHTAINETDAMITTTPNICLMILVADCVPLLFFDIKKRAIGAVHAGWKGTMMKIAQHTVSALNEEFHCLPQDIIVGIGPCIGPCCYAVGTDVIDSLGKVFSAEEKEQLVTKTADGVHYFNLLEANRIQLLNMGIPAENIECSGVCTSCNHSLFFSHRRQKGIAGRFGAGIMLRNL